MASFNVLESSSQVVFSSGLGAAASKTYTFVTAPNGISVLDFQILGGFDPGGSKTMSIRFRVNSTILGTFQFHRWLDHSILVPERSMVTVPPSALVPFTFPFIPTPINTLVVEGASGVAGDYFFIGPLAYHTN
jgi:hypothetical protein